VRFEHITVVVPTRNEEHKIVAFLDSLPPWIQLVVVDASQDGTPELIEAHRPERTLVLRHPGGVSEARQVGAEATKTPWVLFSDADVIFPPDYFGRLASYTRYDVVYGPKLSTGEFASYYRWSARGQGLLHRLGIPAASGSNLLVSRHAFFATGGFDLQLSCNEDTELVWRIKQRGYPVLFVPELAVYARDHRRLERGALRKTTHSLVRYTLLYFDLIPPRWRVHDWGYWSYGCK
jgi:glycosyltransferase involved in cell wall biosynthesis